MNIFTPSDMYITFICYAQRNRLRDAAFVALQEGDDCASNDATDASPSVLGTSVRVRVDVSMQGSTTAHGKHPSPPFVVLTAPSGPLPRPCRLPYAHTTPTTPRRPLPPLASSLEGPATSRADFFHSIFVIL